MSVVVGIDEVGRGAWAGPVVAGAVVLPADFSVPKDSPWKLNDSKLLTNKERHFADIGIRKQALVIGLGWVSPKEVDVHGLTIAVSLAMQRAVEQINIAYDEIIIDGNYNFLQNAEGSTYHKVRAVVRADGVVPAVSAASIVAKVARDKYMHNLSAKYPEYAFNQNVGYGTKKHSNALIKYGITPLHRKSYKPVAARLV